MKKTETVQRSQLETLHLSFSLVTLVSYHCYLIRLIQKHDSPLQISSHCEELPSQTWCLQSALNSPADVNLKKPEEARDSTVESQGCTAIPKISFHRNKTFNRNQVFSRMLTICL